MFDGLVTQKEGNFKRIEEYLLPRAIISQLFWYRPILINKCIHMPIVYIVIYLFIIHMYYCVIMSIIKHTVLKGQEFYYSFLRFLWASSLWRPPRRNRLSVLIDIRIQPLQSHQRRLPTASLWDRPWKEEGRKCPISAGQQKL